MPAINIVRGAAAPKLTRVDVKASGVFRTLDKNKAPMQGTYAHIGVSDDDGKLFSVNLANGELASTANRDRAVELVGSYEYKVVINPDKRAHRTVKRSAVKSGDVFIVENAKRAAGAKPVLYGALGKVNDGRLLSVNFSTRNTASTINGNSNVKVIGEYQLIVTKAA